MGGERGRKQLPDAVDRVPLADAPRAPPMSLSHFQQSTTRPFIEEIPWYVCRVDKTRAAALLKSVAFELGGGLQVR